MEYGLSVNVIDIKQTEHNHLVSTVCIPECKDMCSLLMYTRMYEILYVCIYMCMHVKAMYA